MGFLDRLLGEDDPAVEAALREAESALPGWRFSVGLESYSHPGGRLKVHDAWAEGPAGEQTVAVALDEASAYRAVVRRVRGTLAEADGWSPPVRFERRRELGDVVDDPDVQAAYDEAVAAAPPGWEVSRWVDKERHGRGLVTYGTSAGSSDWRLIVLAVGLSEPDAYRQLARRFRGELAEADAWAPPLTPRTPAARA